MSNAVISSLWRNDARSFLRERVHHLLSKTWQGNLRWVWVVGDSYDDTETRLRDMIAKYPDKDIQLVRCDTGIASEEPNLRMKRMSTAASVAFDCVRLEDDVWLHHESDLASPKNVLQRLYDTGKDVVAGSVWLNGIFYDTWGYVKDGVNFSNQPPYHLGYVPDLIFEVDRVGSVYLMPAEALRKGVRCYTLGVAELCEQFKALGYSIWCDPTIRIEQPQQLWTPRGFPT